MEEVQLPNWEELGLLSETPDDRKDKVKHALDITMHAMVENEIITHDGQYQTLVFPIMIKIVSKVDVPDDDIPRICNEARKEYKEFISQLEMCIDNDMEFAWHYIRRKIEEYQNKK